MLGTKKGFTGTMLPDQGLKILLMVHTKRPFSGKEIFLCCQEVLKGRNIDETMRLFNLWVNNTIRISSTKSRLCHMSAISTTK